MESNSASCFRGRLMRLVDHFDRDALQALKFLLTDFVPAKALQEDNALIIFMELMDRELLSEQRTSLLGECVHLAGLQQCLCLLSLNINDVMAAPSNLSPYRRLLFNVASELSEEDVRMMLFLKGTPKSKHDKVKNGFELLSLLEKMGSLRENSVGVLLADLENIHRQDLKSQVWEYHQACHRRRSVGEAPPLCAGPGFPPRHPVRPGPDFSPQHALRPGPGFPLQHAFQPSPDFATQRAVCPSPGFQQHPVHPLPGFPVLWPVPHQPPSLLPADLELRPRQEAVETRPLSHGPKGTLLMKGVTSEVYGYACPVEVTGGSDQVWGLTAPPRAADRAPAQDKSDDFYSMSNKPRADCNPRSVGEAPPPCAGPGFPPRHPVRPGPGFPPQHAFQPNPDFPTQHAVCPRPDVLPQAFQPSPDCPPQHPLCPAQGFPTPLIHPFPHQPFSPPPDYWELRSLQEAIETWGSQTQVRLHAFDWEREEVMDLTWAPDRAPAQDESDEFYPMSNKPRGFCLVINNKTFFPGTTLIDREGTELDEEKLCEVFTKLHFEIMSYHDLTAEKMLIIMKTFGGLDHGQFDCFVCCIMSHGNNEGIYGIDGLTVSVESLISPFRAQSCPSLWEKPKIFFLQACRGTVLQTGTPVEGEDLQMHDFPWFYQPHTLAEPDFLLGFCTTAGYASFRRRSKGSWYMQELLQQLENHAGEKDLLEILTKVNNAVSQREIFAEKKRRKQVPAPAFTLTKKVLFP